MTETTRDEEYKIVDKLIEKYKCRVIKSEERPYTLFCAADIGKIINIASISTSIQFYPDYMVKMRKMETNGGEQDGKFLTLLGLYRILTRTRKPVSIDFANDLGIKIEKRKFTCTETDCIECIKKAFKGEEMIEQYAVGKYKIDLYIPKYNLVIECDENRHNYIVEADANREENIYELLDGCWFIRFYPDKKDFNIFKVINDIHTHIMDCHNGVY